MCLNVLDSPMLLSVAEKGRCQQLTRDFCQSNLCIRVDELEVSSWQSSMKSPFRQKQKTRHRRGLLKSGAPTRDRTKDTGGFNPLLYRLSYSGNEAPLNPFASLC